MSKNRNRAAPPNDFMVYDIKKGFVWMQFNADGIEEKDADNFEKIMKKFADSGRDNVKIFINGVGSEFDSAIKIIEAIKSFPNEENIEIIAFDYVRSGCFLITQGSNKAKRLATCNTKLMFHCIGYDLAEFMNNPTAKKSAFCNRFTFESLADDLRLRDAAQALIFAQRGRPISKMFDFLNDSSNEINDRQAKKYELIDGYFDKKELNKFREAAYSILMDREDRRK